MTRSHPTPEQLLARRHAADRRFRLYGLAGLGIAMVALVLLLGTMLLQGWGVLLQARLTLPIQFDPALVDPKGDRSPASLAMGDYRVLVSRALQEALPEVKERAQRRTLGKLMSDGASYQLQEMVLANPALVGTQQQVSLAASDDVDMWLKGTVSKDIPENQRRITDAQAGWIATLEKAGALGLEFNSDFFTRGDSRDPEMAGVLGAIKGSFLALVVTFLISFPLGVATAVYLEEYAVKGRWADFIEVNINNLAAVPSIVFGLLGLALFLNFMHMPRSAPLVGGLTLALMTLPTLVIATRSALRSVPQAIRDGARALGASPLQVVLHHVLPLAVPGMLTGSIIGMARALGETAPLLLIGMVAFIMDVPDGFTDPATALPVQIFLWADSPERAFLEKTAGATLVLLGFLLAMNGLAVLLRHRFERRW
ncbi:MAG: phosphate ABC transporter permease PstA [Magnetococcales bacterium]|nr:phosphate ABC transporter permease PstA [Magnetococcales bacterium]